MSINDHISTMVHNIKQLHSIHASLTRDALQDVAYMLVISRIDYCNLLYLNLPDVLTRRLQMLINAAARTISGRFSLL